MITATRLSTIDVVIANIWVDASGEDLKPGQHAQEGSKWGRTEVFHIECYDGRYGQPDPSA